MASMTIATASDSRASVSIRDRARQLVGRQEPWQAPLVMTAESTCVCGQALECCHRRHCPRCGITLHH
jgi:hypothetical protein